MPEEIMDPAGDERESFPARLDPDDATLRWGVKESLRTYVVGVGGEFAVDRPAQLDDGIPVLPLVSDTSEEGGRVLAFAGTIRIHAHGGMMNVHWSDLQIELRDDANRLTAAGTEPDAGRIPIADLVPDPSGQPVFRAGLTNEAAAMFGHTYPPGTELDQVVVAC